MTGGLGNQMFIYAFYLKMKKLFPHTKIDLSDMMHYHVHHGYEMNRVFALPHVEFCMNRTGKKILEFLFFKTILERKQKGLESFWKSYVWPLVYFKGFYQSERFFADIETDVRKAFTFDMTQASERSKEMAARMDADLNAVSLHIRRGDYLEPKHWENTGSVCQLPYYRNAIAAIKKELDNPVFLCVFRRSGMGERKSSARQCRIYRLE